MSAPPSVRRTTGPSSSSSASLPVKRLTPAQIQERHDKGLFCNCDERFSPGHKYKAKFYLLTIDEEDDERNALDEIEDNVVGETEVAAISLHALTGQRNPSTIRMPGFLSDS